MNRMATLSREQLAKSIRGIGLRQVRLVSGMVLFSYLVSHFLNHALGNVSMAALARGVYIHTLFWQFLPIAVVFYTACLVHAGLGIWALYERRQFKWKAMEPIQLVLGLSIPALIIAHIVGVRLGQALFEHEKLYPQELYLFFVAAPMKLWQMFAVMVIAWVHGSIGLYFWLRMKAFYRWGAPFLLAAAVLIPTLAFLGIYQGGRTVIADSRSSEWRAEYISSDQVGSVAQQEVLDSIADYLMTGYLGLVVLVLLAKGARTVYERRGGMINLTYGNGRKVRVPKGLSVLEASLRNNVPHASVCGGRARAHLPYPHHRRLQRTARPSQREAFRARPRRQADLDPPRLPAQADVGLSFFQLFLPHTMSANAHASSPTRIGQERYLVNMFVDMRGSTQLAEKRLPFDTVYIVNRFSARCRRR
jgi:adenylate cyclase